MPLDVQFVAVLQLFLAVLLSALIGLDRERRKRPAGLRTHMLVGLGACIFAVVSFNAFGVNDRSRVASNIVVGIGFLGAGAIIRDRDRKDLTTAASIWVTAAVGMSVGVGAWFLAICATLLIWTILVVLYRLEQRFPAAPAAGPPVQK
ncbi:MAG TPA: MgtC/SapB family protein [Aggregatilineales bacterium]|nr:MgtC/SapB family protein [Aggregatilineales bacterium]